MALNAFTVFGSLALALALRAGMGLAGSTAAPVASIVPAAAETVAIAPAEFEHHLPGEYLKDGRSVAAPRVPVRLAAQVEIMAYQVSMDEYALCVEAGACKPADARGGGKVPVTGVNFTDATAYARWYSEMTGESWRLPTDVEWAYAAAERFRGDIEAIDENPDNPASAWLSSYKAEAGLGRTADPLPHPPGHFGKNSRGVADMAGNVWEWTATCYSRVTLAADGRTVLTDVDNCGVHAVEGFHRTYMSNFVRDGMSGGCAVGLPPDNLGFRLVREPKGFLSFLAARIRRSVSTGYGR